MHPTIIFERRVPGLSESKLAAFVRKTCRKLCLRGAVTVLITSSRQMRKLNERFRGKNSATDVLSFPGPAFTKNFAGEIAVCLDIAGRNARTLGHSVSTEIKILVLHGLLHLAGYNHDADHGEMAARERVLRQGMELPTALIERTVTAVRLRKSQEGSKR